MICRILGGIYLSSIEPINSRVDLRKEYNITHILSVLAGPLPSHYTSNYVHKQIEINDEETSNIIEYFDEANEFIDSVLFPKDEQLEQEDKKHKGFILVHCSQGVSRSVTIIMAYLMQKYNLSFEQSLHAVKRKYESAEPNAGFIEQLKLYKRLNCKVDKSNDLYKQFLIYLNLKLDPSGLSIRDLSLNSTAKVTDEAVDLTAMTETNHREKDSELRCKRCRQILALNSQIETHEPPSSDSRQSQFIKTAPNSRRIISAQGASSLCSHHFLKEPLNWMRSELEDKGEIEGKFQCPKCNSKIGGYSWKGSRCSCGKWMIPAIHLHSAKVDNIKPLFNNNLINS